jgi:hypothetical protein
VKKVGVGIFLLENCAFIAEKCKEFNRSTAKTLFVNFEISTLLSSKHFIAIRVGSTALCIQPCYRLS